MSWKNACGNPVYEVYAFRILFSTARFALHAMKSDGKIKILKRA
jgi:hypothetical protein